MTTIRALVASGHDVLATCQGCGFIVLLHPDQLPEAIRETVTPQDIERQGKCKRCGSTGPTVTAEVPGHRLMTFGGHG
ncbi:MAG TPA: hypothetical protein DCG48_04020 [Rhodospirillaceae bacterium]|nr:hypothetical protein [Rhodospirillaceae bacterium]